MPRKNRSKKGMETQTSSSTASSSALSREKAETETVAKDSHPAPSVFSSAAFLKPTTMIERPTQGQRRLPFGERKYDSDCGSELSEPALPESDNDYDYEEDEEDDGLEALATDPFAQI
jgi:hypothetical protein